MIVFCIYKIKITLFLQKQQTAQQIWLSQILKQSTQLMNQNLRKFQSMMFPLSESKKQLLLQNNSSLQLDLQTETCSQGRSQESCIQFSEQVTISTLLSGFCELSESQIINPIELCNQWKFDFYAKLPKMFIRRKYNQFNELIAIKDRVINEFGQVSNQFLVMQKKEQANTDKMRLRQPQKKQYVLHNVERKQYVQFSLVDEDYYKLMPYKDLNDTLIDSYLKILSAFIFPEQTANISYVFSTYLIQKLTLPILKQVQERQIDIYSDVLTDDIKKEVNKNFTLVQRWNKKIDIFDKQILIFPINMISHWFCIIVINPRSLAKQGQLKQCQILFCDSMFESRPFVIEAIREYLRLQLHRKHNINLQLTGQNAPAYQLLLPRQTNNHDCGLYMLAYIEQLLLNRNLHFGNLEEVENRNKLLSFPCKYMHSLRQRIMNLFIQLYQKQSNSKNTAAVIASYLQERNKIYIQAAQSNDYSIFEIDEFAKYLSFADLQQKKTENSEKKYAYEVSFNLSSEVNYYQKDAPEAEYSVEEDTEYN